MVYAYGAVGPDLAPHLEGLHSVVTSEEAFGQAYFQMCTLRSKGEPFAGMLLIEDPRAKVSQSIAYQALAGRTSLEQRVALEQILYGTAQVNGKPLTEVARLEPELTITGRDCLRLCDLFLVRSFIEYDRYRNWFGTQACALERWIPKRELGDWSYAGPRDNRIVVWGPGRRPETMSLFVSALAPLHAEIVVICDGGSTMERAQFLTDGDPACLDALATCACVVDASISDPSWTYAFAARGVPVAYATTSGAAEWVRGGSSYSPWGYRSILAAAQAAIAGGAPGVRVPLPTIDELVAALEETRPRRVASSPLVSVVIPTFNRRDDLVNNALRSIRAQEYTNLEIIIVNDGGETLADLSEIDPRIRVFDLEVNRGGVGAASFGMNEATGKYLQLIADDDALYPDHVARLVEVLERTGHAVGHANTLIRYEGPDDSGKLSTIGYNADVFNVSLDPVEVMGSSPIAGQGLFMRLDLLRELNFYRDMALADQELQIRLIKASDFVHVARFTNEWLIRGREHNISRKVKDQGSGLQEMYDMHPSDDPFVVAVRQTVMKNVTARTEGWIFPPVVSTRPFEM